MRAGPDTMLLSTAPLDTRGDPVRDVPVPRRSQSLLVASVDAKRGVIRVVSTGTAQITATCGNRAAALAGNLYIYLLPSTVGARP